MAKTKKNEKMMKKIKIPEGVEAKVEGTMIIIKKGEVTLKRKFLGVNIEVSEGNIVISTPRATKRERKIVSTYTAHIKNMINGLEKKYTYKLKVCTVHFPMTVTVDKEKKELVIKNFLGERELRKARIMPEAEVKINGDIITVESHDVEQAGQTAANFEKATKVRLRDRRIFQDGIVIIEKAGEAI